MAHSDVSIVAAGGVEKFSQSAATDTGRGTLLLNAVAMLASGDHLILGPGGFDVGTNLIVVQANNVVISGSGPTTVILGQPPGIDVLFRPAGDDIELRHLSIHANGGSGHAFGSETGKPRGDRFVARSTRLSGTGATLKTIRPPGSPRVSRWWDCEIKQESNIPEATAAFWGEHDHASSFACRFHSKMTTASVYGMRSDSAGGLVQRFYNCDTIAETGAGRVVVGWSFGNGLEYYGGRVAGTPPGNPNSVAGEAIRFFATLANLQYGGQLTHDDSNIPRWRVIELVPTDFAPVEVTPNVFLWVAFGFGIKQFALRDGELVLATLIQPVEQFSGPGITDYKISVGKFDSQIPASSIPALYADATDVDVIPGDTVFRLEDRRVLPTLNSSQPVPANATAFATASGAPPNQQGNVGKVRIHLLSVRPWAYVRDSYMPVP